MKIIHLKSILLITVLLAAPKFFAQVTVTQNVENLNLQLRQYIGEFNGEALYLSGTGFESEALVTYANGIFTTKAKLKTGLAANYIHWFIAKDKLYAVRTRDEDKKFYLELIGYDFSYEVEKEVLLLKDSAIAANAYSLVRIAVSGNVLAVAGNSNTKENFGFAAFLNLETGVKYKQRFSFGDQPGMRCTDVCVNKKGDVLAVYEGRENQRTTTYYDPRSKGIQNYLVSCSFRQAAVFQLAAAADNQYVRSFRFSKIDEEKVLLGGLLFRSDSKNMIGYYTANVRFGAEKCENGSRLIAENLLDKQNWRKKDRKKAAANKSVNTLNYQFLKEIRPLADGSFLFISEAHCTKPPEKVRFEGYADSPDDISTGTLQDLIVSRVQPAGKVLWTGKTKFRKQTWFPMDINLPHYMVKLDKEQDKLQIFYAEDKKHFGQAGKLDQRAGMRGYSTTAAVLELKLTTGEGDVKSVFPDFRKLPDEALLTNCSYVDESGTVFLMTNRWLHYTEIYRQVVLDKGL